MTQLAEFSKYWKPKQFIGMTVFDNKGQECGKICSLLIDPKTFSLSGILTKKRFGKEYFLSQSYFEKITETGLYLNSIPIKPNDKVANTDGKVIGKVIKINLDYETNKLKSIEIKSRFKIINILSKNIVGVGDKITVNS